MKEPHTLPLDPPATVAELDHAAEIWTAAQDVMVARGFSRLLWGCGTAAQHEFVVLMLRAEQARPSHPGAPLISSQNTQGLVTPGTGQSPEEGAASRRHQ